MPLKIPQLGKPGNGLFKTSLSSVRKWVDNLPLINIQDTVSRLEFALDEINKVDIPATERIGTLELLNAPVMHATGALKKGFLGKQFPLRERDLARAGKAIGLCRRMALGYKILIPALEKESDAKSGLATTLHRSIRHLSEVLIGNFQIYVQYPDGVWQDLHTLYAIAGQHGVLQQPVVDITLRNPESTTIEDVYKQILLLSLACPYRLRQREISDVYALLHQWGPYSRLYTATDADASGFFACNLDSDNPPAYLKQENRDELDERWRILDTGDMEEPVRAAVDARQGASQRYLDHLEDRILQRLMLTWGVIPKRQFARHQQDATVQMVLGLSAIHRVISGPPPEARQEDQALTEVIRDREYLLDPTFEQPTRISTAAPAGGGFPASRDVHIPKPTVGQSNPLHGAYVAHGHVADRQRDSLRIESWRMQDMSAGGYCLLWDSNEPSSAQVGELVAIKTSEDSDDNWHLGVIRWMKFTVQRGLGLGIQMMSPGASAIWASICSDRVVTNNKMQGILLPDIKGLNQEATLLLPPLPFRSGSLSTLTREGNEEQIRLTRQLEDTGSFAQFHFTPAGKG
jgi:hypothetical protein